MNKTRIDCDKRKDDRSAVLRRFIRYLYEYENGRRIRNVGFVKVEEKETSAMLNIHGKGLGLRGDETLKLYIFYMDGNVCRGIWQGDIINVNPALNYRLIFTEADTGHPENFGKIEGVILVLSDDRKFAAVWNDMEVDVDNMQLWEEACDVGDQQFQGEEENGKEEAESLCAREEEDAKEQEEDLRMRNEEEHVEEPKEDLRAENKEACEEEPAVSLREHEESEAEEDVDEYMEPTRPQFQKIVRGDIARLPRCEWRLANNSFLIHGFRNYHHLVFLEDGDGFWLGVPGIYHEREARAAEAFGFPRFVRADEEEIELDANERCAAETFGYWCRKVRRGVG